jgi:hypothetical protein
MTADNRPTPVCIVEHARVEPAHRPDEPAARSAERERPAGASHRRAGGVPLTIAGFDPRVRYPVTRAIAPKGKRDRRERAVLIDDETGDRPRLATSRRSQ